MSKKNLNQKSLFKMQEGGMTSQPQQMSLAQQIGTFLQSGMDPRTIAQQLYLEGVDESEIKEAFMDLGMSPSEVDELFKSEEELQEDLQQDLDEAAELAQQDMQSEPEVESDSDVQSGIFGNYLPKARLGNMGVFPMTVNQWFGIQRQEGDDYVSDPRANYLPMDLGMKGTPLGAGFLLAEAATDLFGGKTDPSTGLKRGFYRNVDEKRKREKEAIPEYYNYKITTAAGDPNTYVADRRDAYAAAMNKGKLRTEGEYKSKEYKGSLGISPTGEPSRYRDVSLNPYYYETMMGLNTLPTVSQTQPEDKKPLSFMEWYLQDPVKRSSASAQADYQTYVRNFSKKFGGTIPKAQFGMNIIGGNTIYGVNNIEDYRKAYNENRVLSYNNDGQLEKTLDPVTIVADRKTGKQYPYYDQLTEEEKKYFNDSGRIGSYVRAKAEFGKSALATSKGIAQLLQGFGNTVAEFTGIPGAIRFAEDPVQNLKNTRNFLGKTLIKGSPYAGSSPYGNINLNTQVQYTPEEIESFINTLDVAGIGSMALAPLKAPVQAGLRQGGKYLIEETAINTLPKAKNFREVLGTLEGIPTERSLARLSPEQLKTFRQVQEIGRMRAKGKPLSEQYRYALDQNIPDEDFIKIFGKSKDEVLNPVERELVEPGFANVDFDMTDQVTPGGYPTWRYAPDLERRPIRRDAATYNEVFNRIRNEMSQNTLPSLPEELLLRGFNNRVRKRGITQPLVKFANDKLEGIISNYPVYRGQVKENVPYLSLRNSGTLKNVSKEVTDKSTSGISSGDVFTGSLNTSHSSYLPQLKELFKYTEGTPQFLGYKPMNSMGFLSEFEYSTDAIAKYLNTEIDKQIKRGIIPSNIQRPYVKKNSVLLPHYGIKQFQTGKEVTVDYGDGNIKKLSTPDYSIPMMAYGGDIIYAQVGIETEPMSYDEWLAANGRGRIGQELQDSKDYQAYVASFGSSTSSTQQVTEPKVEITNKMVGDFNRFMGSRPMEGYGDLSNFAVKSADFINEMVQEEKAKKAEGDLYKMTQADILFGYSEDSLNKRGTWDVNTGLAQQNNYVPYLAQFGGEDGSSMMYSGDMSLNDEIELDPDTIAQLIAAGANIEIL